MPAQVLGPGGNASCREIDARFNPKRTLLDRMFGRSKGAASADMAERRRAEQRYKLEQQKKQREQEARDKIEKRDKQKVAVNRALAKACLPPLLKPSKHPSAPADRREFGPVLHFEGASFDGWSDICNAAHGSSAAHEHVLETSQRAAVLKLFRQYTIKSGSVCRYCNGNDLPLTATEAADAALGHNCPKKQRHRSAGIENLPGNSSAPKRPSRPHY